MTALTVRAGTALGADLAPVLATLPDDFVLAPGAQEADVVVVDGRAEDWPTAVREAFVNARGVLLREPVLPVTTGEVAVELLLRDLAREASRTGVPVVVDRRWSGAPGTEAFAAASSEPVSCATSVTVLLVEDHAERSSEDAALDALGLARASGAAAGHLARLHRRPGSWSAWGSTAHGAVLHLQGVHVSAGAGAEVTATSAAAEASLRVPSPQSAAPALARCADEAGERSLPTEFEPATRAAWRRLRRALGDDHVGLDAGAELEALAEDVAVLGGAV